MAEARAETPDTDDDVHLGNDMDLSPRSHSPSSPVPDAIANYGALFPVSDDNAALMLLIQVMAWVLCQCQWVTMMAHWQEGRGQSPLATAQC